VRPTHTHTHTHTHGHGSIVSRQDVQPDGGGPYGSQTYLCTVGIRRQRRPQLKITVGELTVELCAWVTQTKKKFHSFPNTILSLHPFHTYDHLYSPKAEVNTTQYITISINKRSIKYKDDKQRIKNRHRISSASTPVRKISSKVLINVPGCVA